MIEFKLNMTSTEPLSIVTLVRTAQNQGQEVKFILPKDGDWSVDSKELQRMISSDKMIGPIKPKDEFLLKDPRVIYGKDESQFKADLTATAEGFYTIMAYLNMTKAKFKIRKKGAQGVFKGQFA